MDSPSALSVQEQPLAPRFTVGDSSAPSRSDSTGTLPPNSTRQPLKSSPPGHGKHSTTSAHTNSAHTNASPKRGKSGKKVQHTIETQTSLPNSSDDDDEFETAESATHTSSSSSSSSDEDDRAPPPQVTRRPSSVPRVGPQSLDERSLNNSSNPMPQFQQTEDLSVKDDIRHLLDERRALLLQSKHIDYHLASVQQSNTQRFEEILALLLGGSGGEHAHSPSSTATTKQQQADSTPLSGRSPRSPLGGTETVVPSENKPSPAAHVDPTNSQTVTKPEAGVPLISLKSWTSRLKDACEAFKNIMRQQEDELAHRHNGDPRSSTPTDQGSLTHRSQQPLYSPQFREVPVAGQPRSITPMPPPSLEGSTAVGDDSTSNSLANDSDLNSEKKQFSYAELDGQAGVLLGELAEVISACVHEQTNTEAKRRKLRRMAIDDVRSTNAVLEEQHQAASERNFAAMRARHQLDERFRESVLLSVFDHLETLEDFVMLPFGSAISVDNTLIDGEEGQGYTSTPQTETEDEDSAVPVLWHWGMPTAELRSLPYHKQSKEDLLVTHEDVQFDATANTAAVRLYPLVSAEVCWQMERQAALLKAQLEEVREAHAYQQTDEEGQQETSTEDARAARRTAWMHRAADQFYPDAYVESLEARAQEIAAKRRAYLDTFVPLEEHCSKLHSKVTELHRLSGKSPTRSNVRTTSQTRPSSNAKAANPSLVKSSGGVPQRQRSASISKSSGNDPLQCDATPRNAPPPSLTLPLHRTTTDAYIPSLYSQQRRSPRAVTSLSNVSSQNASPRQPILTSVSPSAAELQIMRPQRPSPMALDINAVTASNKEGGTASLSSARRVSPRRGLSPSVVSPRSVSPVRKNGMHHVPTSESHLDLQFVPRAASQQNVTVNGGEQLPSLKTLLDRKQKLQKQLADLQRISKRELSAQLLAEEMERKRAADRLARQKRRGERLGS